MPRYGPVWWRSPESSTRPFPRPRAPRSTRAWSSCCGFPEIGRDELFRFFTLAPADVAFVDPGRGRGPRIGWGWPWRCARCRGWGSSRTTSSRRRRWRWPGWLISSGSILVCCVPTGGGRRPGPSICGWWRSTGGGGCRRCWSSRSSTSSCWRGRWSTIRVAHRGRVRARLAPLLRPGRPPVDPGPVVVAAGAVLPAGRQTGRPRETVNRYSGAQRNLFNRLPGTKSNGFVVSSARWWGCRRSPRTHGGRDCSRRAPAPLRSGSGRCCAQPRLMTGGLVFAVDHYERLLLPPARAAGQHVHALAGGEGGCDTLVEPLQETRDRAIHTGVQDR